MLFHIQQLLGLGLQHAGDRDARPGADHGGDVAGVHDLVQVHFLPPFLGQLRVLAFDAHALGLVLGGVLIVARLPGLFFLALQGIQLRLHLLEPGRHQEHGDAQLGRSLVHQVDRLVGQPPVADIAVAELDRLHQRLVVELHLVVVLIAPAQPAQDGDAVFHVRLVHVDGRKAPLQRRVALDVLAVLVQRRGADALQLAARQRRLEHVRGVHRPRRVARAHHRVQLIDEENDLALAALDLFNAGFQALLKLAAEAGARHHRPQVERDHLLAQQRVRHVLGNDLLRQPLDDGRLADAGLADQHRVVLGAP